MAPFCSAEAADLQQMDNHTELSIRAASCIRDAELKGARLGQRFGRLDKLSQLAVLAVESLGVDFDAERRERIGICVAAKSGSLATDVEYWQGRDAVGGPSPTLFAYTLPSSALGEIAIRYRLTGPNLCFAGEDKDLLPEAADMIQRGEADACVCVSCDALTPTAADVLGSTPAATACAAYLERRNRAGPAPIFEIHRDTPSLCDIVRALNSAG